MWGIDVNASEYVLCWLELCEDINDMYHEMFEQSLVNINEGQA